MIMRKETIVFLTSLAIIFIIGYVNMTMTPENIFNEDDYAQIEETDEVKDELAQILENETDEMNGVELVEVIEKTDTTDITINPVIDAADLTPAEDTDVAEDTNVAEQPQEDVDTEVVATDDTVAEDEVAVAEVPEEELDYVILGDITNILDDDSVVASSEGIFDMLNSSFANFKLNKEKGNEDVIDHLEENLSNDAISADTKSQFEALLLNKNDYIEAEKDIELMLQTKGYNETVVIVDSDMVKVVSNDTIEQADATKILNIIVTETNYEPSQIKIVKFDNIDL